MKFRCFRFRIARPLSRRRVVSLATGAGISVVAFMASALCLKAQVKSDSSAEFKRLAAELSTARLNGTVESEISQEKALGILDELACSVLNSSALPDLDAANQRMAGLVSHTPPVGENYRLMRWAAARRYTLWWPISGSVDRPRFEFMPHKRSLCIGCEDRAFRGTDFFDSDIELVPVSATETVFVIVAGRTDDLATGMFSAWRFDGHRAVLLWIRICFSSQTMRPMETDSTSRTARSPMTIIRRSA